MDRRQLGCQSDHEIPKYLPERPWRQRNDAFRSIRRQRPAAGYRCENDPQRAEHVQLDRLQVDRQRRRGSELPRTSEVRQEIGRIDLAHRMRHDHHGRHLHFRHDSVQRNPQRQSLPGARSESFQNLRRAALLPDEPWPQRVPSDRNDRHGLRRAIHQRTSDGVRSRVEQTDCLRDGR